MTIDASIFDIPNFFTGCETLDSVRVLQTNQTQEKKWTICTPGVNKLVEV